MIVESMFYGVVCDRCKCQYESEEYSFWYDKSSAIENATDSDWIKYHDKHYCDECIVFDEELDEYIPLPDFPDCIEELNVYLKKDFKAYSKLYT